VSSFQVQGANGAQGVSGVGNSEIVVEQMRERADLQAQQAKERVGWTVQMFSVKYLDSTETLKGLCIFPAEIIPQPALHVISVRTAQTNMSAIGDAIKRLDVPQAGPKSVELMIQILVASDQTETLRQVPASLNPVVDQLKGVLAYKQFFLLDTLMSTTADAHSVGLNGTVRGLNPPAPNGDNRNTSYQFRANLRIGSGELAAAAVRLSGLSFSVDQVSLSTDVDIPPGKQVVVGKATAGDRAFILVVSAKILN